MPPHLLTPPQHAALVMHAWQAQAHVKPAEAFDSDAQLTLPGLADVAVVSRGGWQRHSWKSSNQDAFLALPALDPAAKATATTIVSAWYLGVVGEPADAELITYAEALMYRPTRGILPIPTYGPGPNNWGPKPDSKI